MMKNKIFTIPNILSFLRIALIPFIVWSFIEQQNLLALGLIALSALTDIVDGYVARHFNQVTTLGKALDPVADKMTLLAILICVALQNDYVLVLMIIFAAKELIMGAQALVVIKLTGTTYGAFWYGKVTTVVLYLSLAAHIIWPAMNPIISLVLICISLAFMTLSFVMYTLYNVKFVKQHCRSNQQSSNS